MPAATTIAIAALAVAASATTAPVPTLSPRAIEQTRSPELELRAKAHVEARATVELEDPLSIGRPLSEDPHTLEGLRTIEQRLRAGGSLTWSRNSDVPTQVSLRVEADAFNGPSARSSVDDSAAPGADVSVAQTGTILAADPLYARPLHANANDKHVLRRFEVEVQARWGQLLAGRTVSKWGVGLIAQDGVDDPLQFGFKRRGNIVDRVQAVVIPAAIPGDGTFAALFPVAFAFAADNVVEDDLASAAAGESATNLIAAAVMKLEHFDAGLYAVSRYQEDQRGLIIDATVTDLYGRWHDRVGRYKVEIATELMRISGDTTYFRTPTNPNNLKIDQLGGVARATISRAKVALRLEAGFASGDQNAYDDTVRNLKFARDHRVGLVLFGDVLRRSSAATAANLADRRFSGQAPAGYERIATGGAVSQAMYLHPVLRIGPFYGLSAMAGMVLASAPSKLVDPYKSGLQGGAAIGPMGGTASTDLGTELDLSVQYRIRFGRVAAIARADWGCATLGAAFADAEGNVQPDICAVVGQAIVRAKW